MEIARNKDGTCSAFVHMHYERAGRADRNYLKPVICTGLIIESDTAQHARSEMLTRIRAADVELSEELMETV